MTEPSQDRPTVLVIGATGRQGGSVARHLLAGRRYAVRALTSRPLTDEAKTLAAFGAEVVKGSLDDHASLAKAMRGVDAVFGVTDWWEHFDHEETQGRALVDIAMQERVRHLVLSTQQDPATVRGDAAAQGPFATKARVERYARMRGVPASFVHVAFYWENLLSLVVPRPLGDGRFELSLPVGDTRLGGVGEDDIGGVVAAVLARGAEAHGQVVPVIGDALRAGEIAAVLSRVTGREIIGQADPLRAPWAGVPGAEALARALDETFATYRSMQDGLDAAIDETRRWYPATQDLERWATAYASELRWTLARLDSKRAPRHSGAR
jgi:uncharacterized protein YbjT (DUF2867 family)